ncbi:hypothetical protein SAMN05421827_101505 [Pedobacter terrae]|uniref:Uncharacterized protein n=1 Tax=Pedobacter terrae TaxID=405671 RepID=A0A1G7NUE5_9SPHI|nr:hypothetical protein [Pedobacter terrae]SDF77601.1 hypothetical protein SAMN05421827_101505 [Pedobacter terrae]
MNVFQKEWIELLIKQDFPEWNIGEDGNDILVKIPDSQDLQLVIDNFPETILAIQSEITNPPRRLKFLIGNSKTSGSFEINPK